jgi:alginate O-acetyltransferase complex protein AlgI
MLFNSFEFLIFFPLVVLLYFLFSNRFRWILLLVASYSFYMFWRVEYALILVISTLIDYICGCMMGRYSEEEQGKRKPWLWLSLLSNLGILFTFKYYNFFNAAAQDLSNLLGVKYVAPAFELLLPMGISFYTFQTMSYSIDVYYGRIKAEKHLGIFALFVTFFPQLVAGPIERAGNLLNQLKEKHEFDYNRVTSGLKLMAWGLFKKVVIADRLAVVVNQVYNNPTDYEGIPLIIATVFFALQIYCDFSGYSDMAIGAAQVMGFRLMENFRRPYFSKSIKEFWARWHISLSTWFRDYLYIPLGGNRVIKWRWYYNMFLTFLVSGLWHGANWTFLVWGALHGFYLVFGFVTAAKSERLIVYLNLSKIKLAYSFLQIGSTFFLVCLAWIFFRANTISDAMFICKSIVTGFVPSVRAIIFDLDMARMRFLYLGNTKLEFLLYVLLPLVVLMVVHLLQERLSLRDAIRNQPIIVRWSLSYLLILAILVLGVYENNEFIYFQF